MATVYRYDRCKKDSPTPHSNIDINLNISATSIGLKDSYDLCSDCLRQLKTFLTTPPPGVNTRFD